MSCASATVIPFGSSASSPDAVFVPQPGPDSATAREIAARYTQPDAEGVTGGAHA